MWVFQHTAIDAIAVNVQKASRKWSGEELVGKNGSYCMWLWAERETIGSGGGPVTIGVMVSRSWSIFSPVGGRPCSFGLSSAIPAGMSWGRLAIYNLQLNVCILTHLLHPQQVRYFSPEIAACKDGLPRMYKKRASDSWWPRSNKLWQRTNSHYVITLLSGLEIESHYQL